LKIRIFYDDVKFRLQGRKTALKLIEKVIAKEKILSGDLNFIFTTDQYLLKINNEFLKHNYFTDVIAFSYNEDEMVNNEVYISIDTVKRNAHNYKISLKAEVLRVMIHGVLHLCGYDDKTVKEKFEMKRREDMWLLEISDKE
jgi:probable rRNA maturation factor